MPGTDGTGPTGKGPMTGRGNGRCIVPLNTRAEELNYLKNREKVLKEELESAETRLRVLAAGARRREKRS